LQDETNLIIQAEKLKARQHSSSNGTVHTDLTGSEFWFYCIDPSTDEILSNNHKKINSSLLSTESLSHISNLIGNQLGVEVSEIRPPLQLRSPSAGRPLPPPGVYSARLWDGIPVALMTVGIVVFLLALGGTVYICITWRRFQNSKPKRMQPFVIFPPYDSVVNDPNPKEYETQIMQLSVNSNDGSDLSTDMNFRPRRNHAFPLDNASYVAQGISSSSGHKSTPSSCNSDIATLRISRLAGKGRCEFSPNQFFKRESPIPTTNPLYEGYSLSSLSSSASNAYGFSSYRLP